MRARGTHILNLHFEVDFSINHQFMPSPHWIGNPKMPSVESWHGETLLSENSSRNQSQMALSSLFKRGYDEACGWGLGRGTFYIPFRSCFISFYLNLFGVPTSLKSHLLLPIQTKILWVLIGVKAGRKIYPSLHPHEGEICVLFSLCQTGHFGNKNVSWVFGPDWVDGKSIAWLEGVRKGVFAREPLGEPPTF